MRHQKRSTLGIAERQGYCMTRGMEWFRNGLPDAPRQGIASAARHAGFHQGVEYQALWLPEPGHDRHGERGEHDRPVCGTHAPRHLAAVGVLSLLRDLDPVLPGLLAEPAAAAVPCRGLLSVRRAFSGLRRCDRHDDRDLLAVKLDLECAIEPLGGHPAGKPAAQALDRTYMLLGLVCTHVIIITQRLVFRNLRTP